MTNSLVPLQKQINTPGEFNYLQPRTNFYPLQEIRKVEEHLFSGFLSELPNDESEDRNLPVKSELKADLPLARDYGEVGYETLLPIRGILRELQYT